MNRATNRLLEDIRDQLGEARSKTPEDKLRRKLILGIYKRINVSDKMIRAKKHKIQLVGGNAKGFGVGNYTLIDLEDQTTPDLQRLAKIVGAPVQEWMGEAAAGKRPPKAKVDRLIRAHAEMMLAGRMHAPHKVYQRKYKAYMDYRAKLEKEYPHIAFHGLDFERILRDKAEAWIKTQPLLGPGIHW